MLPLAEQRHQHMAAVRKFDRVVMPVGQMPVGQAEVIKKDLLAQGARTTITEADTKSAAATPDVKEKQ